MCCLGAQCCPVCTFLYAYLELKPHYKIEDKCTFCKCCFPVLSLYQMLNEIMVKEGLHMVMAGVAADEPAAGAPPVVEMQR